jgi:hypothetical protein
MKWISPKEEMPIITHKHESGDQSSDEVLILTKEGIDFGIRMMSPAPHDDQGKLGRPSDVIVPRDQGCSGFTIYDQRPEVEYWCHIPPYPQGYEERSTNL